MRKLGIDAGKVIRIFEETRMVQRVADKLSINRSVVYPILKKAGYEFSSDKPKHNLVGKTFGHLEVLQMARTSKSNGGVWRALCKCHNCGNHSFDANVQNLMRGTVTSCGCRRDQYQKMTGSKNSNFTGFQEIRGNYWSKVKRGAAKRGIAFDIDIRTAWDLFEQQGRRCLLSGLPLRFAGAGHLGQQTASLDRVDSERGYVAGNVAWVHKDVNIMKGVLTKEYFVALCDRIARTQKVKDCSDEMLGQMRGTARRFGTRFRHSGHGQSTHQS